MAEMVMVMVVRGGGWRNDAGVWLCLIYFRMLSATPGLFLQMLGAPTAVTAKMFSDKPDVPWGGGWWWWRAELHTCSEDILSPVCVSSLSM